MKPKHTELKTSGHMVPIAGFGAALAALTVPPNVDAAIISLTANPGSIPFLGAASAGYSIDLVGGTTFDFYQFNDTIGKTFSTVGGDIYGFIPAPFSNTITAGDFVYGGGFDPGTAGTVTYGFLTTSNQVGWIQMNLGGASGAITYVAAAFNDTPGGSIGAGKLEDPTAVPEPETLPLVAMGLLALGAAGVRRHRRRRVKASETAA